MSTHPVQQGDDAGRGSAAQRFVTPSTAPAPVSVGADTVVAGFVPPAALLARGVLVGRYVILDCVGSGGMGRVYAAYDPDLGRKVALKLLHDDTAEPQRQWPFCRIRTSARCTTWAASTAGCSSPWSSSTA